MVDVHKFTNLSEIVDVLDITGDIINLGALGDDGHGTVIGTVHDHDAAVIWIITTMAGTQQRARILALEHSLVPLHIPPHKDTEQ